MSRGSHSSRNGPSITVFLRPYDDGHRRYSVYYYEGMRRYLASTGGAYEPVSIGNHPDVIAALCRFRNLYRLRPLFDRVPWLGSATDRLASLIEGEPRLPGGVQTPRVLQFLAAQEGGQTLRVCVDPADDGGSLEHAALDWSDVYFKTNYWPTLVYPPKVRPLVNADGSVLPRLGALRQRRSARTQYDVCMVVRVWGGKDEVEGVEHNLRLIEAISRARCSKFLYAYLVAGDIRAAAKRLESQGIPCGTAPLPPVKLWDVTAASRLNVIRLGMHYCIPWRVTGALAIGSAIVLDRAPLSRWPEPLTPGVHYVDLGVETGKEQPLAPDRQYAAIPGKIEAWLADTGLSTRLAKNSADYFDHHAAPERVGEYLVKTVSRIAANGEAQHVG